MSIAGDRCALCRDAPGAGARPAAAAEAALRRRSLAHAAHA